MHQYGFDKWDFSGYPSQGSLPRMLSAVDRAVSGHTNRDKLARQLDSGTNAQSGQARKTSIGQECFACYSRQEHHPPEATDRLTFFLSFFHNAPVHSFFLSFV
jgi:hypothetical protein